jgi:hypothetical protein
MKIGESVNLKVKIINENDIAYLIRLPEKTTVPMEIWVLKSCIDEVIDG